ncbi:DUF6681 family protein [Liquorilactobacillus capillatus]|uniref:Uncharacterized protein n=1 Tax=Liquorilactobacillus capillatus DSM 19910 TaxID=1423731 RepID=A0A0R1LYQ1_9LACO|nr:DUF6681 family protein [Liquorilactobacillus capillatus]KRL00545.1 hypothetical protein FC81_GL002077 [Liquorilactobacillus capillatus DSM 19910]
MFSIIGLINSYLGYININVKLKNRVYTALGTVGNFYLLYVAYRFLVNGFLVRGLLFILAFFVIAYFLYLNIFYFFTSKRARFDFSPWLEAKLGMKPKEEPADKRRSGPQAGFVQTNGLFEGETTLPAKLECSTAEKQALNEIVAQLETQGYLKLNYGGYSDREIFKLAKTKKKNIYALNDPVALPYFELVHEDNHLELYGGINQIEERKLGRIQSVGLMPVAEVERKYSLFVAAAVIQGGAYKFAGRSTAMHEEGPYDLKIQVAYRKKNDSQV